MVTQKVKAWDMLQDHPIAKELDADTQVALLCEYIDLWDELGGMSLTQYIDAYFADAGVEAPVEAPAPAQAETKPKRTRNRAKPEPKVEPKAEEVMADPSTNGDESEPEAEPELEGDGEPRPASMVGLRVVYRFPGRNVLSDENGVTSDTGGVVAFTDVDGEPWTKIGRERVFPINPHSDYHRVIHIIPREAREIDRWLSGTPEAGQPEGALLRSLFVEFIGLPEKIAFAIMNGKRPYVDRFVALPDKGFEDDQKPITRLFGEHCFRVRGKDYIVNVVTP
jgi:hypothetical protein